jgi:hypothetical protein
MDKFCNGCDKFKDEESDFGKSFNKKTGTYRSRHRCKECLNKYQKEHSKELGSEYLNWKKKYKEIRREENPILFHVQERISQWRKADPDSNLTTEYLVNLWKKQNNLCYYTGTEMVIGYKGGKLSPNSLSLDKMDPEIGYKIGNVVWVCYQVNTSKGARSESEFYDFCKLVLSLAEKRPIQDHTL